MNHRTCEIALRFAAVATATQAAAIARAAPARADVPGTGIVTDLFNGASGWAFDKVAEGIAKWVLGAVGLFVSGAVDFLRNSARPDVESAWFSGANSPYATVRNIAAVLLVGFVFLGIIQGLLHGDPVGMARRIAGSLPLAVAGMVVTTAIVARLLELVDALSQAVLSSSNDQALHFLSGFGASVSGLTQGFAAVLLGMVAALAAMLLWVELVVRSTLVYLLVAISPLGFAATLWPAARGFLRKTVELLVAVILSKFVISVALAIGVAALSGAGNAGQPAAGLASGAGASLGTLLSGAALLGLAAFSPFLILKLIPVAEAALVAQGVSRTPARAAQTGLSTYSSVQSVASRLSGSGGSGGPAGPNAPSTSALGPGDPSGGAGGGRAGRLTGTPAASGLGNPATGTATAIPAGSTPVSAGASAAAAGAKAGLARLRKSADATTPPSTGDAS